LSALERRAEQLQLELRLIETALMPDGVIVVLSLDRARAGRRAGRAAIAGAADREGVMTRPRDLDVAVSYDYRSTCSAPSLEGWEHT
jgi:hypothetical protein